MFDCGSLHWPTTFVFFFLVQELRKECAKSKAAKEEQRLERLIRKTIRDKEAASVDIFLKHDEHRTGKLNQVWTRALSLFPISV